MRIAVHINKDPLFDSRWTQILAEKGIEVVPVNLMDPEILEIVKTCDGVMWHYRHLPQDKQAAAAVLNTIERQLGIPVWPNYETRWHFDEKVSQHYLLSAIDAPRVRSWVFWDEEDAKIFLKSATYPLVFKLSVGAGAANVIKVDNVEQACSLTSEMFKYGIFPYQMNEFKPNDGLLQMMKFIGFFLLKRRIKLPSYYSIQKDYVYFQEFVPNNEYDIRITVIGRRAFGFIRYNREGDFRASGSGKIDYSLERIPIKAVKIALEVSLTNGFQSMAYDFLLKSQDEPVISEISYGYVDKAVYECPGYWDDQLDWHEGHMWPEEAHIEDFIEYIMSR